MRLSLLLRGLVGLSVAAALLTPAWPARADGGGGHLQQNVAGYSVELVFENTLTTGLIPVQVYLSNAEGQMVPLAKVQVVQSLTAAAVTDGHGTTSADTDGASEDDHSETGDGHSADDGHDTAGDHTEVEASHAEPGADHLDGDTPAEGVTDAHDEAIPHTHDETSLFQLSWNEAAGAHAGDVIFFQPGQWAVHVEFTIEGEEHVAEFTVDVLPPDPGRAVLAVFASLNAVILGTAVVLKRKSTAA